MSFSITNFKIFLLPQYFGRRLIRRETIKWAEEYSCTKNISENAQDCSFKLLRSTPLAALNKFLLFTQFDARLYMSIYLARNFKLCNNTHFALSELWKDVFYCDDNIKKNARHIRCEMRSGLSWQKVRIVMPAMNVRFWWSSAYINC
jgi:hypothetical protein